MKISFKAILPALLLMFICVSCSNKKERQQAEIAINATTPDVGITAVAGVSDEELLGKIAMEAGTPETAAAAFKKLKKLPAQKDFLINAAKNATQPNVRLFAVENIDDQGTLAFVAKNDPEVNIRLLAVGKISDQDALVYVAKNDTDNNVNFAAAKKIKSEKLLVDMAKNAKNAKVHVFASTKVNDQTILANIAINDSNEGIRLDTTSRLHDQGALNYIAKNDSSQNVRLAAVQNINDKEMLFDIVMSLRRFSRDPQAFFDSTGDSTAKQAFVEPIGIAAVKKITDQDTLVSIISIAPTNSDFGVWTPNYDFNISVAAMGQINDQKILASIIANHPYSAIAGKALEYLTDQQLIIDIVNNDKINETVTNNTGTLTRGSIRCDAVMKITDLVALTRIIYNPKNTEEFRKVARARWNQLNKGN